MKLGVPFLQFPLVFDAAALAAEVQAIDESAWRPHPAGYADNDAWLREETPVVDGADEVAQHLLGHFEV